MARAKIEGTPLPEVPPDLPPPEPDETPREQQQAQHQQQAAQQAALRELPPPPEPPSTRPLGLLTGEEKPAPVNLAQGALSDEEKQRLLDDLYGSSRGGPGQLASRPDRGRVGSSDYISYTDVDGRERRVKFDEFNRMATEGRLTLRERQSAQILDRDMVKGRQRTLKWVDAQGRELAKPPQLTNSTPDNPVTSPALQDVEDDADGLPPARVAPTSPTKAKPGQYVYWGDEPDPELPGSTRPVYMLANDAEMRVTQIPPEFIAKAQIILDNPVTGRPDDDLTKLWNKAVQVAGKYAATGQRVSVQDLFADYVQAAAETAAKKRTGGYGGGGGYGGAPKAVISDSYAKAALSAGMLRTAGREPSNEEVSAFRAVLQASWDSGAQPDPAQMAVDWTRQHLGAESQSLATSNYLDSIMSIMGERR